MKHEHSVDVVFALALFCVFAASILMVLMSGAGAYRSVAAGLEQQYEERVCLDYIAAKVRHYDARGMVETGEFAGGSALVLTEEAEGSLFRTIIYHWQGKVMELFVEDGTELGPEAGLEIIEAEELSFESVSPGLMRVSCAAGGRNEELLISLRSESGAA